MSDAFSIEKNKKVHCVGGYCNLRKVLDTELDVVTNDSKRQKGSLKRTFCKKLGRERAYKVLQQISTKNELDDLEDNAYITHLSITHRIRPSVYKLVPSECIDANNEECRIAFLRLQHAEGVSRVENDAVDDLIHLHGNSAQIMRKKSSGTNITVCEMCYHTYKLLSQSRCLRDERFRKAVLGKAQDVAFGLTELMNSIKKKKDDNLKGEELVDKLKHGRSHSACQVSEIDVLRKTKYNSGKRGFRPKHGRKKKKRVEIPRSKNTMQSQMNETRSFLLDESTTIQYTILDSRNCGDNDKWERNAGGKRKYNLIVCHDIFETHERMKIFMLPFINRHDGHKILLWNYPGQAHTTFPGTQCLNNEFHVKCLERLLLHVSKDGKREFDTSEPFYLMGYGYGGSVACLYAKLFPRPAMRALFLVNPLSFVDTHFASIIHDCRNVFHCSPESRPDLPLYFYSRFLFSDEYLKHTSTPFALNLYTAVHNPISIEGRIQLCDGVLKNVDLRGIVEDISIPIITLHGDKARLVRPLHADTFAKSRQCCQTIYEVLNRKSKNTLIIATHGGHELLQEGHKIVFSLMEQLLIGFHEVNDVALKFGEVIIKNNTKDTFECALSSAHKENPFVVMVSKKEKPNRAKRNNEVRNSGFLATRHPPLMLDPGNATFERHNNCVYKPQIGSNIYPVQGGNKITREYMSWRLKRNRKRLSRFQRAAHVIQNTLRIYMAKTMVARLKRDSASRAIQRVYRGSRGRLIFKGKLKELWAAHLVQRTYRGSIGRKTSYFKRVTVSSQIVIARHWRGFIARVLVGEKVAFRNNAATSFQTIWRRFVAIQVVSKLKLHRNSAITIERIYRGVKGRNIAELEKERYIFSRSQSKGIELGRQMLSKHKLSVSRLQSELSMMEQEKKSKHTKMKELMHEIATFQDRVQVLEKSVHNLSAFEAGQKASLHASSSRGTMDISLREKKVKLDEEFSSLLVRISDRRNQLRSVEMSLSTIENLRKEKERSLKLKEQMLLALLESQEREIEVIRNRQAEKVDKVARRTNNDGLNLNQANIIGPPTKNSIGNGCTDDSMNQLMNSTEAMMKFGFLSMTMTHFSSINMMRAIQSASSQDLHSLKRLHTKSNSQSLEETSQNANNDPSISSVKQSSLAVAKWEVDHVIQWLKALSLGQYEQAFRDGSVDGPFLCQLTDDDLVNVIGIEHKLHRKKVRIGITELVQQGKATKPEMRNRSKVENTDFGPNINERLSFQFSSHSGHQSKETHTHGENVDTKLEQHEIIKSPSLEDLSRWVRNQKYSLIKDALIHIPGKGFDNICVDVPYMDGLGTLYEKSVSDEPFHVNKSDEHGNTLLHIAAQNGNLRIAKLLIDKGANPNHQNNQGQTPGHFAVAYQFYEFASWLFDEDGGNGNDLITNIWGLGPYDGLNPE